MKTSGNHHFPTDTRVEPDQQSVASGTSSKSRETLPCIYCNKDFQLRSMFNHIRTKHDREFALSLRNKLGQFEYPDDPIEVEFEWDDEQDVHQWRSVFGCLSSNKTFLTKSGVKNYWKKNLKDAKAHEKEMKKLKSKILDAIEAKKREKSKSPYSIAVESKDSYLVRAIYRFFLYLKPRFEQIKELIQKDKYQPSLKEDPLSTDLKRRVFLTMPHLIELIDRTFDTVYLAIENKMIDYHLAQNAHQTLLFQILPCIEHHYYYSCYDLIKSKTEDNPSGIRTNTIYAAPYFDIAAESDPELDF